MQNYNPKLHLFVDDHAILRANNVDRVLCRPRKHSEPVIRCDRPWESSWIYAWGSVLRNPENGRLQMWYSSTGYGGSLELARLCYAESSDGIHWDKPHLGRYAMAGVGDTNIVHLTGGSQNEDADVDGTPIWRSSGAEYLDEGQGLHDFAMHFDGPNILRDEDEPDPNKRYKWIGCLWPKYPAEAGGSWAHHYMTSADGISWSMPPRKVLEDINDGTRVQWDPIRRKWMLFWLSNELASIDGEAVCVRYPEIAESDDLIHWTQIGKPFKLDEHDNYGGILQGHFVQPFVYGDQYIGFASMIHSKEGWAQSFLISSRDGRTWDRLLRRDPFIVLGSDEDFDADSAEAAMGEPVIIGDYMYIYYCGRARRHWAAGACTGAIGLVRLKRDRFVGLTNGGWFPRNAYNLASSDGEILTKPVEVTGPSLYVNARTRTANSPKSRFLDALSQDEPDDTRYWGTLRVELLDESMTPIPGYGIDDCIPVTGDAVRIPVRWKHRDGVSELLARKVHVRFVINHSAIYAYTFDREGASS